MSSRAQRLISLALCLAWPFPSGLVTVAAQSLSAAGAEEAIERLADGTRDRDPDVVQAALIDLDAGWSSLSARAEARAIKTLGRLFKQYKPRDEIRADLTTDEEEIRRCYRMAVGLLFDKPDGDEVLRAALKAAHIKRWPKVQANLLEGLGYRQDPAQLGLLAGYLDHAHPTVVVAAAAALGWLAEADRSVRRQAAGKLVKAYERREARARKERRKTKGDDPGPDELTLGRIEYPLNDALRALTRQRYESAQAWSDWLAGAGRGDDW